MDQQLFEFSQSYLSTVLNLNILLITASGILLFKLGKDVCGKILFAVPLLLYVVSTIFVVSSHESFFYFLLRLHDDPDLNLKRPFTILDCVFGLDILALLFTLIALVKWIWETKND